MKDKKKTRPEDGVMNNRMEEEGSEQGYMEAKPESKPSSDSEPD